MSDLVSRLKEAGKWVDAEACFTAADEITRLRAELVHERFLREQSEAFCEQVQDQREQLRDENERLRRTLHRISLASQNSMSTKTECGALARKALLNEELSVSNAEAGESIAATVAALWGARAEIEKLREALNAIVPISCHQLHHDKKDRHRTGDPCPVEVRIEALKRGRSE